MRVFISRGGVMLALAVAACSNPTSINTVLHPSTIPPQGIYAPEQVVVTEYDADSYEFAAAGTPAFTEAQITHVAYCRASLYALNKGFSGWFTRDAIATKSPFIRQVNVIVTFYRGEKPPLVENKNETDWCR